MVGGIGNQRFYQDVAFQKLMSLFSKVNPFHQIKETSNGGLGKSTDKIVYFRLGVSTPNYLLFGVIQRFVQLVETKIYLSQKSQSDSFLPSKRNTTFNLTSRQALCLELSIQCFKMEVKF